VAKKFLFLFTVFFLVSSCCTNRNIVPSDGGRAIQAGGDIASTGAAVDGAKATGTELAGTIDGTIKTGGDIAGVIDATAATDAGVKDTVGQLTTSIDSSAGIPSEIRSIVQRIRGRGSINPIKTDK